MYIAVDHLTTRFHITCVLFITHISTDLGFAHRFVAVLALPADDLPTLICRLPARLVGIVTACLRDYCGLLPWTGTS